MLLVCVDFCALFLRDRRRGFTAGELHGDDVIASSDPASRNSIDHFVARCNPAAPPSEVLLYILTVTNDGGVPIYFQAASGNVVDDQTRQTTWKLLAELKGRNDFVYVADRKNRDHRTDA